MIYSLSSIDDHANVILEQAISYLIFNLVLFTLLEDWDGLYRLGFDFVVNFKINNLLLL